MIQSCPNMLDALNEEVAPGLAELTQHDLALARDFARRAQAADNADKADRLARCYQRAAQSSKSRVSHFSDVPFLRRLLGGNSPAIFSPGNGALGVKTGSSG